MTCSIHLHCGEVLLQLLFIGLSNGAILALNAIGVTLVYGAVRTINFAYGDLFALATVLIMTLVYRGQEDVLSSLMQPIDTFRCRSNVSCWSYGCPSYPCRTVGRQPPPFRVAWSNPCLPARPLS